MYRKLLLVPACLVLLSGCGFQLKGATHLPARLAEISIQGGEPDMVSQLTGLLTRNGASVVGSESDAIGIRIIRSEFEKEVSTTSTAGIATGYQYRQTVEFTVTDRDGTTLLPRSTLSQARSLDYTQGNELELEEEEDLMRREMNAEIASRIVRLLARI